MIRITMVAGVICLAAATGTARAEPPFTIGTGAPGLTYAPIGEIVAGAILETGTLEVETVPSRGSLDNITALAEGRLTSGFAQSDVAYWAYEGSGIWSGSPPVEDLRTIAALYEEHIHIVTRADSGIEGVGDLRNRRISLGETGSGTYVDARLILEAAGVRSDEFAVVQLSGISPAIALKDGGIDAFFAVAGYPVKAIAELAQDVEIKLVPIDGDVAVELIWRHGFLAGSSIPDGAYAGVAGVETVSLGAHWYTRADVPDDVVYALTDNLFSQRTQRLLQDGHPKGRQITAETSLDGVAVPLHPGAVRWYEDAGVMD